MKAENDGNHTADNLAISGERLSLANDLLTGIIESTSDIIAAEDTSFRFIAFNEAYRKEFKLIFGKDIEIGTSMVEALAHLPEDRKNAIQLFRRALQGETVLVTQAFGDPGRSRKFYELRFSPIRDMKGRIIGAVHFGRDVTQRIKAEEALREREANLMRAQKIGRLGSWEVDLKTNMVHGSEEVYRIFNMEPNTHIESYIDKMHPDDRDRSVEAINQAIINGAPYNIDYRVIPRPGELLYVHSEGEVTIDQNGEPLKFFGIVQDITERKLAEETLRESESRFRQLFESDLIGIAFPDRYGGYTEGNDEFLRITGYTREDLKAGLVRWDVMTPPEYAQLDREKTAESLERGSCTPYEKEYIRKDGSRVPILIGYTLLEGSRDEYIAFILDTTKRKQAEEERERLLKEVDEQRARLQSILDSLPVGVWVTDSTGKMVIINDVGHEIWGGKAPYSGNVEAYREYKVFSADSGESVPPEKMPLARALRGETIKEWAVDVERFDGTWGSQLISAAPIMDEDGDIIGSTAIVQDITRLKQVEEALKQAKAQAELYIDLMGHDINNMNHSAMGYLELALETLDIDRKLRPDDRVLLEKPLQAIMSSSALIDNVRKLQRLMTEGVKTMPVDLHDLLNEIDVGSFCTNDRDITVNIPEIPHYMAEANDLLKDAFINLITNAIKHSDEEKPLTVDVVVEPVSENDRIYYRCAVEDNGPGVPDELKGKLFHRFQRGATKAHGKGLGLYLVRTLVEGYGGRVWVEDRVHGDRTKGARFVILLPVAE